MNIARLVPLLASSGHQKSSPEPMFQENLNLRHRKHSMTAVFTGATHGIGLCTLQAFVKHMPKPKAFIIGRSRQKFDKDLQVLQALNPEAEFVFLEAQLSLIREVDRVCDELKYQVPPGGVDLLCMSQSYAPVGGRVFTEEDLDEPMSLIIYGRMRMAKRLAASDLLASNARVVSVGGGGKEGHLFEEDLELKDNFSIMNFRGHAITMMTLALDALGQQYPEMTFIHVYPGTVATGLLSRGNGGYATTLMLWVVEKLMSYFAMTAEESGEWTLWAATSDKFAKGSLSMNYDGASSQSKELSEYRETEDARRLVWEHITFLWKRAEEHHQTAAD